MFLMTYIDVDKEADGCMVLRFWCSNHMCGKRELFSQFDNIFRKSVKLGNNSILCVIDSCHGRVIRNQQNLYP